MLDGQLPDPARPDTAVIDQDLAAREHLRPGGTLHLLMIPNGKNGIPDLGRARAMSFRVTGIAVFDSQIVPATKVDAEPAVLLSPGFYRSAAGRDSTYGSQAGVRLRPGVSVASFAPAAAALAAALPRHRRGDRGQPAGRGGRHPAGHPPAGRRPGPVRRAGGPDRAGRHRPAAQPPAQPGFGRVPGAKRPGHEPGRARGPVPGPAGRW